MGARRKKCGKCGQEAVRSTIIRDFPFDAGLGRTFTKGATIFEQCADCDFVILSPELIQQWTFEILEELSAVARPFTPREIEFILCNCANSKREISEKYGISILKLRRLSVSVGTEEADALLKTLLAEKLKSRSVDY